MLCKTSVAESTLGLIKKLCSDSVMKNFFLVGGTAVALQIDHRRSIDIDLFSGHSFDSGRLDATLRKNYNFQKLYLDKDTLKGTIDQIFVDIMTHPYPLVSPLCYEEGVRMASLPDIAAMKLNAIIGNGSRLKDFVDIAFMSSYLNLRRMMDAYKQKYSAADEIIILKALLYHADVDFSVEIDLAKGKFDWKKVSKRIDMICKNPDKIFPAL